MAQIINDLEINMKKYNVTVNGTTYEVVVEEAGTAEASAPVQTAAPAPAKKEPVQAAAPVSSSGKTVNAPMPGNILSMNVNVGDKVAKDQLVCILEAMKMENEIFSPVDGTVTRIVAGKGASVETGAVIIELE